jgi:hypothetical protein
MATRFPSELLENILRWLDASVDYIEDQMWLTKRELGSCSLVCRYWTGKLQPRIFLRLRLQNKEDALALVRFIKAETGELNVRQYIRALTIEQAASSRTWAHLVTLALEAHPCPYGYNTSVVLEIQGNHEESNSQATYRCRTIFSDLPGLLPSSCTRINYIKIVDVRFRNVHHMLSYLRSSPPTCETIECCDLTLEDGWDFTPSDVALNIRRSSPGRLWGVSVRNCHLRWPFLLLLLRATQRGPRETQCDNAVYVRETEVPRLLVILQAISADLKLLHKTEYAGESFLNISQCLIY